MIKKRTLIRVNEPIEMVSYGESVIPKNRLEFLVAKCRETLISHPGNILEVGVYRGGTLSKLAETLKEYCPQYKVYGVDTFSGHPYTDGHPVHPKGKYSRVDLERLLEHFDMLGLGQWVTLIEGKVEDVFSSLNLSDVSFAHIDCDLYIPTKFCAERVPHVMKHNSVIFFDDYGHEHCPGATEAVNNTFKKHLINEVYLADDNTCWSCTIQIEKPG